MQYFARLVGRLACHVMPSRAGAADGADTEPGPDALTRARPIGGRHDGPPTSSMLPLTGPGPLAPELAASLLPRLPRGVVREARFHFDARPRDFVRIWWRHALIVLLTGGLALPWARAANRRWLLQHTRVGGHALDLLIPVQSLWLRDFLGVSLLAGVAGALAGDTLWAAVLAVALACCAVPIWLHLRLADDLSRITWGGRRLAFDGSLLALYGAVGLAAACTAVLAASGLWLLRSPHPLGLVAWGALLVAVVACFPAWWWRWLAYRQQRLRLGPLALIWRGAPSALWQLGLRTLAWSGVAAAGVGGGICLTWAVAFMALGWQPVPASSGWLAAVWVAGSAVAVWPFLVARLQNLAWNHTGCRHLRFRSKLPAGAYVRMRLMHLALVVLSGGLYWPWAVFHAWRFRTEALSVRARIEPEALAVHWPVAQSGQ